MSTQADNGKAFEWAVGEAFHKRTGFVITASEYARAFSI